MSQDRPDFAKQVTDRQRGAPSEFFPIVINPAAGAPGNQPMQIGQSYEIPINACDHIWLPTYFDASIAINPLQGTPSTVPNALPIQPPTWNTVFYGAPSANLLGMNVFDMWNATNPIQLAAIFALKFNNPNAPWLVWSLSDGIQPVAEQPFDYIFAPSAPQSQGLVGHGDFMRSVSGPIARLFFKLLAPACVWTGAAATPSLPGSLIVLMSSLGFSEQTQGAKQVGLSSVAVVPDVATAYPQNTMATQPYGLGGGGYIQTNVNTLEEEELRCRHLGSGHRA